MDLATLEATGATGAVGTGLGILGTLVTQHFKGAEDRRKEQKATEAVRTEVRSLLKFVSENVLSVAAVQGAADPDKLKPIIGRLVDRLSKADVFTAYPEQEQSDALVAAREEAQLTVTLVENTARIMNQEKPPFSNERMYWFRMQVQSNAGAAYDSMLKARSAIGDSITLEWKRRDYPIPVSIVMANLKCPPGSHRTMPENAPSEAELPVTHTDAPTTPDA